MRTLRGFTVGFLALTFLEVYLTSKTATAATGSLASAVASVVQRALSPAVAAIPNPGNYQAGSSSGSDASGILKSLIGPTINGIPYSIFAGSQTTPVQTSPQAPQQPALAVVNA